VKSSPFNASRDEVGQAALQEHLEREEGNITRAAKTLGLHRSRAMVLVKRFGLSEFARKLRVASGFSKSGFGRPPA
jgi:transcriptional regulator of acetoin/glycerol metabolism